MTTLLPVKNNYSLLYLSLVSKTCPYYLMYLSLPGNQEPPKVGTMFGPLFSSQGQTWKFPRNFKLNKWMYHCISKRRNPHSPSSPHSLACLTSMKELRRPPLDFQFLSLLTCPIGNLSRKGPKNNCKAEATSCARAQCLHNPIWPWWLLCIWLHWDFLWKGTKGWCSF